MSDDMLELAQRLDFAAECSDMGRKPDHSSVTRRSAKALRKAAAEILSLRAELTEQARLVGMGSERELKLIAERDEAYRRRDEWRKKAEGFDTIRRALREKIGDPPPLQMSRFLWAAVAADEKKRADDAEAERDEARGEVAAIVAWLRLIGPWEHITPADLATAIEARAYVKENDGD